MQLLVWLGCQGPPRNLRGLVSLALVIWMRCLEPTPTPHPRRPSPHFSLAPGLWATRPLITLGRPYRPGSILPPKPASLLRADGWQPAPFDKLIRPNLSTAAQHSPCLRFPSSCLPAAPHHWSPGPLPVSWLGPNPSWALGRGEGPALRQARSSTFRGPTPPAKKEPGALMGSYTHPGVTGDLLGAGS